jgi:DNA-binding transcriptional regulator YhcF (GntR family)
LHHHVVQELGERIVRGELKQGELLPSEEVLATRMSVSRTALREAIKVLSAKGLIESRPKIGTRIRAERYWSQLDADVLAWRCASMPTHEFSQTLMQMREIIEPAAAALAARFGSVQQVDCFGHRLSRGDFAGNQQPPARFAFCRDPDRARRLFRDLGTHGERLQICPPTSSESACGDSQTSARKRAQSHAGNDYRFKCQCARPAQSAAR